MASTAKGLGSRCCDQIAVGVDAELRAAIAAATEADREPSMAAWIRGVILSHLAARKEGRRDYLLLRDVEAPPVLDAETTPQVEAGDAVRRLTYTVDEVAVVLGISRHHAFDAVRAGDIPAVRIGRRLLVPRIAIAKMIAGKSL